jgi:hypothetical protein
MACESFAQTDQCYVLVRSRTVAAVAPLVWVSRLLVSLLFSVAIVVFSGSGVSTCGRANGTLTKLQAAPRASSDAARPLPRLTIALAEVTCNGRDAVANESAEALQRRAKVSAVCQLQLVVRPRRLTPQLPPFSPCGSLSCQCIEENDPSTIDRKGHSAEGTANAGPGTIVDPFPQTFRRIVRKINKVTGSCVERDTTEMRTRHGDGLDSLLWTTDVEHYRRAWRLFADVKLDRVVIRIEDRPCWVGEIYPREEVR